MGAKLKNNNPSLKLSEYQARAYDTNQIGEIENAKDYLRFGFFGEVGGLLALVKKSKRDLHDSENLALIEELGDALWYLTTVSMQYDLSLQNVGEEAIKILGYRLNIKSDAINKDLQFDEFDGLMKFAKTTLHQLELPDELKKLGAHCGILLCEVGDKDLANHIPIKILADLLADMIIISALFNLQFDDVAKSNLKKIESKWPVKGTPHIALFDESYSELERFPRQFSMKFIEEDLGTDRPYVIQQMNGVNIGDRLTDNRTVSDGYRFHDVFHLSYLVHLGWSPVIRALLKLKRKSKPNIDENEDGARAIIIEEGIATWIFNHASRRDLFVDVEFGRLNYGLLKQVVDMVDGYEVSACPLWQWEKAILDGFNIFRQLFNSGGGIVHVDLHERTIKFEALPPKEVVAPITKPRPLIISSIASAKP
jgi:NTP pyrophosphatase (non-canonical NTP hydrolase)